MNRKPTALKKLNNTLRKDRMNENEPMPSNDLVAMPSYVLGDAIAIWDEMEAKLLPIGLLTNLDTDSLAMYCISRARYEKATKILDEDGEIITTPNGHEQASPWLSIAKLSHEQMTKKGSEFGLSPTTRGGIEVKAPKKPNPFEQFKND